MTDSTTDYFSTTSELANNNFRKNGIPEERIFFIGNVTIDVLCITVRNSIEHPETIDSGTNILTRTDPNVIHQTLEKVFFGVGKKERIFRCEMGRQHSK